MSAPGPEDGLVVATRAGRVGGVRRGGARVFHGIPYAAAPTGRGRFEEPRPHAPWPGVRDATSPGPTVPQLRRDGFGALDMSPYFGPGWRPGAEHLTVDVWAPARTAEPAPVLVFVHGGGFVAGSASASLYDGAAFARDGVVLVVVQYRLGVPGFLHLPDAPDDRGLLDVVAALRWVREEIASFGGDPDAVTVAGQSAGAVLLGALMTEPAADALARRAILQSGSGVGAMTAEQAGMTARAVARELGRPATATALAEVDERELLAVVPRLAALDLRTADARHPLGGITPFSVVRDRQPADVLGASHGARMDLLVGSNLDEGGLYLAPVGLLEGSTRADVVAAAARFRPEPDRVADAYRASRPDASSAVLRTAVLGDGLFGVGTRRSALAHAGAGRAATFRYEFRWRPDTLDGALGACHVMELPFVFDVADAADLRGPGALLGTTPPPADLAARTHGAWVSFVRTGDPGWPAFTPRGRQVQVIAEEWEVLQDPRAAELDAWG